MALIQVDYSSRELRRNVTFRAVIPNDYNIFGEKCDRTRQKFRTVYLLHGYKGNCTDWLNGFHIQELADTYNFVVIMPSGENSFYIDEPDKGEYYGRFIGKELVEYTRDLFPLSSKREDTFIGGFSMGGYGAAINGLKYSDNFSKIMSFSGGFLVLDAADEKEYTNVMVLTTEYQKRIFGDVDLLRNSDKDPRFLVEQLQAEGSQIPEIFMTCGTEDGLVGVNQKLNRYLVKRGISHKYIEDKGIHDREFTRRYLEEAIQWMLE
ncbi:MAG TPA: acetylesterase [Clostridiales bacterium]|nr:acetylesterase [Clostridiales bacterium]